MYTVGINIKITAPIYIRYINFIYIIFKVINIYIRSADNIFCDRSGI